MNANQQWYLDFGGLSKGTSWRQNTMSICDLVASLEVQTVQDFMLLELPRSFNS